MYHYLLKINILDKNSILKNVFCFILSSNTFYKKEDIQHMCFDTNFRLDVYDINSDEICYYKNGKNIDTFKKGLELYYNVATSSFFCFSGAIAYVTDIKLIW